ncbi:MAG: DNRLRE domain-containing protein, partial [Anaerolineae bacterium]|nr:DNRLRE domain-containing protein [Anaerolineae bacterium]
PGTAKNILTVGASESLRDDALSGTWSENFGYTESPIAQDYIADAVDGMAAFSSRGPTDDGRIKPDVTAPGTMIISSRSHHALAGVGWGVYDDDHIYMGGTSMSAPLTAGAAALVREWLVKQQSLSDPSAALLKALLVNGAVAMTPGQYGTGTTQEIPAYRPNPVSGWGRVDLVQTLTPSGTLWYTDTTTGLATGDTATYTLEMEKAGEMRVVLAWTDYPGSPTAARALVNDLDLEVVGPGGSSYGNSGVYQPGAACLRGGQWDRCNNVEGVLISVPQPGTYRIVVHAHNVPNGPQPFALAANSYFIDSNTPPTIKSLPDRVVPVDVGWDKAIYLPDYVHDAEDDFASLTFILTSSLPSQVVVAIQDDDYIAIDPVAGFTGTTTVEVLVRDTGGLSAVDIFQVEVTGENIPPAITLPDLALSQGDGRTLDLWQYTEDLDDPDEVLAFTLDQSATLYAGKFITGGHYLNIRPYYLGVEQITVQVEDPQGAQTSDTFSVTVTSGQPLLEGLPDLVANAGETLDNAVDLWAYANDAADSVSELAFSIISSVPISAGLTIDGNRYLDISPVANYVATIPVEVQVQDTDGYTDTDAFLLNIVSTMRAVYMPLVVRDWPPIPGTVALNGIDNADGDGAYSVSWEAAERASGYVLQEAPGADFAGAQVVYQGSSLSYAVTGKSPGRYYYRVKGSNSYGNGPWSTTQPVWVMPPGRFYPVEDATLFRGSPELNNGTDSELRVGYESCDVDLNGIVRSVIRFDLSEIPPGTEIAKAELSLLLGDVCYSDPVTRTVAAYRAAGTWSESSVTWNTGPGYAELYGSAQVKTEELQRYTLDITELVVAWVNGAQSNDGLVLRGPEFSGANSVRFSFFTREADKVYAPYLDIDYN